MKNSMKSLNNNTRFSIINFQWILALLLIFNLSLGAQQQFDPTAITQEIDYKIDRYGDAHMELRQKMTALQWQNFKVSPVAQNPTVFKRDLERSMSTLLLEDFKNEMLEDSRTSLTRVVVRSMATYKGNGKWEIKLDSKNPNITKISDHAYMVTSNLMAGGNIIQQLQKVFFPENASQLKQDTDNFGNAVFTYTLNVEYTPFNFLMWVGIAILLAGAGWLLFSITMKK